MQSEPQLRELMTVQDVAARLNLSDSTVYAMMRKGEIPAVKIGSQWRVDPARLDSWIDNADQGSK